MNSEQLILNLGAYLGCPDLSFNDRNVCSIQFKESIPRVYLEAVAGEATIHAYSVVGFLPQTTAQASNLTLELLRAHQFGHRTGGGSFAVEDSLIILWRSFELENLVFESFVAMFERFLGPLAGWQEVLSQPQVAGGELTAESLPDAEDEQFEEEGDQFDEGVIRV